MRVGIWTRLTNPTGVRLALAVYGPFVKTYEEIRPYIADRTPEETNPSLQVRIETVALFLHWLSRYAQSHDRQQDFDAVIGKAFPIMARSMAGSIAAPQWPIFESYFVDRMSDAEQAYSQIGVEVPNEELYAAIANGFHGRIARFLRNDLLDGAELDLSRYRKLHEIVVRAACIQMFKPNFDRYLVKARRS